MAPKNNFSREASIGPVPGPLLHPALIEGWREAGREAEGRLRETLEERLGKRGWERGWEREALSLEHFEALKHAAHRVFYEVSSTS